MAVPTLTSITPSEGHPGGKELIRVEGTNFQLPAAPPATGFVGGDAEETIEVEIDGQLASDVKVWTSTLLTCLTPKYQGDPAALSADPGLDVDVTIRNLDSGPGPEEDTFVDAFTFKRADLTRGDSSLKHVCRQLVRQLRREVIDYIAFATTIDYDGEPDALDVVELAQIPALSLFGPDIEENFFRRTNEKETNRDEGLLEFEKKRLPRVSDVSFEATLTARGLGEYLQLANEFVEFFRRNPLLVIDKDSTDPAAGTVEFDMFLTSGPTRSGASNDDDVHGGTASFVIRGVHIDADEGTRIEWGKINANDETAFELTTEEL